MLLQIFLPKETSETLDTSMTFDFPVSVSTQTFSASLVCLSVSVVGGILLVFTNVFGLHSLGFILSTLSNP